MAEITPNEALFPVKEVPAQLGADIVTKTGHKFIIREDTNEVLSCMTDEYKLIPNEQIYDTAEPIMKGLNASLTECESFSNGAKTQWKWTLRDTKVDLGDGDVVSPEITINDTVLATKGIFSDELPKLKDTKVKEKHVIDLINMIPSNQMESFTQYLMAHKPENYWDLLNSATWIATHSMKRTNEATHKLEQQIYPTITKWAGFKTSAARA